MKVVLTGSSGMIGNLVLNHCLQSNKISQVIIFVRKPSTLQHEKLKEIVLQNFEDYSAHQHIFTNIKAAYFCLGVYTGQVADEEFKKITINYAVEFAKAVEQNSPKATLCLLSGAGADRTEKSKTSFALYKGMAENQIATMNLQFYSFRPAYIYPVQPRPEPNLLYKTMRVLYPIIKLLSNKYSIPSTTLANAMFTVGLNGAKKQILENQDIFTNSNIVGDTKAN